MVGTGTAVRRGPGAGGGRRLGVVGCLAALALSLAGCGNKAGDMTCQAFGKLSYSEQSQALDNLLSEHSLAVASAGNLIGVSRNVADFCGSPAVGGLPATRNLDRPLNDAVDWNAKQW